MDSLLSKIVNTLTGDKAAAQQGKDYWVDDSKCKACYECETPFSVFVRRHHCRICGRIFCSSCTVSCLPGPRDPPDQAWLRICNYCHRMRKRDDEASSERAQSATAQRLLGSVAAYTAEGTGRLRTREAGAASSTGGSTTGAGSPTGKHASAVRSSSSGADGSLTWEVPPVLERSFGPSAEAVAESLTAGAAGDPAAADTNALPSASSDSTTNTAGCSPVGAAAAAAAAAASSSKPISPSSLPPGSSSGLHPLVLLNRQEFANEADAYLEALVWQLLQAEDVQEPEQWLQVVLRLVCEASRALLPAAAAAFGEQDPRFYIKVKCLPDMGTPADSRVVRGVVAKKNVAHRRMRTDINQPAVLLLSGALEYQRVANKLSSFDTLLEQEKEHLRLAVARVAACKPDVLLVERSVARAAQEELLARGISLVQHTKPELLERLGRCMGVKVASSIEELAPQLVGSCGMFKVEALPNTPAQQQQQQQQPAAGVSAANETAAAAAAQAGTAVAPSVAAVTATAAAALGAAALPDSSSSSSSSTAVACSSSTLPRPGAAKPAPVSAIPAAPKTLMIFDGCPLPLGCTVLLWGASAAELTKLKRIVRFGVLAAYHQGLECSFLAEELALATAALATPDMSHDVELYQTLARSVIRSSHEATNPQGLPVRRRLLLSLSPHVLVPDVLEKEQQHEAALLALQHHQQEAGMGSVEQAAMQQQQQLASGIALHSQHQQQQQSQEAVAAAAAAASNSLQNTEQSSSLLQAVAAQRDSDSASDTVPTDAEGSMEQHRQQQQQGMRDQYEGELEEEQEFTDPLRRRTFNGEGALLSVEEDMGLPNGAVAAGTAAASAETAAEAEAKVSPLWVQGLQLYDRQHIYLSMACRNPRRGLMCEPPAIKRIDFYCHSDLSLAGFIVAAAPHAQKKCQVVGCGYGVTCHVRTFLHGCGRITLSIATLPSSGALPGEERGQVWTWLRPKGNRHQGANRQQVRRLPLSQATACMSFGMFLSLCFSAPGLEVFGSPLHNSFVRYFGLGRTVMCLHQDAIFPSAVVMPRVRVSYSLNAQLMWLKQEAAELCQESNEAFDILEAALQSHPYFKTQAAAAAASASASTAASPLASARPATQQVPLSGGQRTPTTGGSSTAADSSAPLMAGEAGAGGTAVPSPGTATPEGPAAETLPAAAADSAVADAAGGSALVSMSAMLSAVRKDRSSFMDKVAEAVQRATPASPTETGSHMMWDDQLMAGVLELNRLRRSLAITSLTWAATLQEPSFFAQMLAASSTAAVTAAVAAAAAASAPPGSPLAAAAAAAAAALVTGMGDGSDGGSAHGGSMFHLPPAVAAQRMGITDGQDGDQSSGGTVSVPIMPNMGPIAVQAVANLVAQEAAARITGGGLLEGSHQVMMAVTQRSSSDAATAASAAVAAATAEAGSARTASGLSARLGLGQHSRSSSFGRGSGSASAPSSPRATGATGTSPGKGAQLWAAVSRKLNSSLSTGASSSGAPSRSGLAGSPQASSPTTLSSSYFSDREKPQPQRQHRSTVSGTGSTGAGGSSAATTAAPAGVVISVTAGSLGTTPLAGSGDDATADGSSDDGEVAHDRFVAWMTSHEITGAFDTDDMSDYFPEQLPDWDEQVAAAAAASGSEAAGVASTTRVPQQRPPTPPATPDLLVRHTAAEDANSSSIIAAADASTGVRSAAIPISSADDRRTVPAEAATAGAAGSSLVSHRRTGSGDVPGEFSSQAVQQQQQPQQGNGMPVGLAPIKTSSASAAVVARGNGAAAAAGSVTVGLQQIARVALPGRALMPAGINDTVIPIFDGEPTSIAAYFLSSRCYQQQLNAAMKQILHDEQRVRHQQPSWQQQRLQEPLSSSTGGGDGGIMGQAAASTSHHHVRSLSQDAAGRNQAAAAAAAALNSNTDARVPSVPNGAAAGSAIDQQGLATAGQSQERISAAADNNSSSTAVAVDTTGSSSLSTQQQQRAPAASTFSSSPNQQNKQQQPQPDWLALLLSPEPLHVKHGFEDESPGMPWLRARFSVTAYFAPQFAELRRRCIAGGEAAYITSLCRCRKWASRGGKSNAYFAKTRDDRFIVKSLSKPEKASFLEFAPAYFEHMARAAATGKATVLAKVAGVYSISIRSQGGAALGSLQGPGGQGGPFKDGVIDVLVMENIFYDRQISRIYDLKGSERSRFNADAAANPQDVGAVHLDDNLRRSNLQAPLLVDQRLLRSMELALWRDTSFLAGLGVMDYSLLVGVDRENNQLVVAIIDFIRTYTWDKQLETWVKASGILGGNGKEPTIVSPKQYMRRFRAAISSYFTVVPDGHEIEPPLDPDAQ